MNTVIEPYSFAHPVTGNLYEGKKMKTFENGVLVNEEEYYGSTAEDWLEVVGFGGKRQPTLLYLRQAGATSAKLDATEQYLNAILAKFAMNPEPQSDWPSPPYAFEEVVAEAVSSINN